MGAAAAATTRFVSVMMVIVIAVFGLGQSQMISPQQSCSTSLGRLSACQRFLVPGGGAPTADCCSALQGIDHDCICNTLRIASRIPTQCNLPALTCGAN